MPRCLAANAAGSRRPSWTMLVKSPARFGTRIGVSQDIAGPHQIEDLRHQGSGFDTSDVHHDAAPRSGLLAGRDRPFQWLDAVLRDHILGHAYLCADRDVGILGN